MECPARAVKAANDVLSLPGATEIQKEQARKLKDRAR